MASGAAAASRGQQQQQPAQEAPALQARRRWIPSASAHLPADALATQQRLAQRVSLARVLGHTCVSNESVAFAPAAGGSSDGELLAYLAGSVVVVYNTASQSQVRFMQGRRGHELHCVSWAPGAPGTAGGCIVAGEKGPNAAVLLFNAATGARQATIVGHAGTVTHARISPDGEWLVVVAEEKDSSAAATSAAAAAPAAPGGPATTSTTSSRSVRSNVSIWRVRDGALVWSHTGGASGEQHEQVLCMDWSPDSSFFVLGGKQFMRFYYVKHPSTAGSNGSSSAATASAAASSSSTSLNGDPAYAKPLLDVHVHAALLNKNEDAEFLAVVCGQGKNAGTVFAVTRLESFLRRRFVLSYSSPPSSAAGGEDPLPTMLQQRGAVLLPQAERERDELVVDDHKGKEEKKRHAPRPVHTYSDLMTMARSGLVLVFKDKSLSQSTALATQGATSPANAASSSSSVGALLGPGGVPLRWEIDRWVNVRIAMSSSSSTSAPAMAALSVVEDVLAVGGGEGKMRLFAAYTLEHLSSLALAKQAAHPARILARLSPARVPSAGGPAVPHKLVTVNSDRVLHVWDVRKPDAKGDWPLLSSVRSHTGPVWDLAIMAPPLSAAAGGAGNNSEPHLPAEGCIASCSGDGTLRVWGRKQGSLQQQQSKKQGQGAELNLSEVECVQTAFVAPVLQGPADERREANPSTGGLRCLCFIPPVPGAAPPPPPVTGKVGEGAASSSSSATSLLSHHTAGLLASGDRGGFVRLHSVSSLLRDTLPNNGKSASHSSKGDKEREKERGNAALVACMEIHEQDVRALEFRLDSISADNACGDSGGSTAASSSIAHLPLLFSAGRDTTLHVHNVFHPATPATFTPEVLHAAPVTTVKCVTLPPAETRSSNSNNASVDAQQGRERVLLLSGGLDRKLVLQSLSLDARLAPLAPGALPPAPSGSVDLFTSQEGQGQPIQFDRGEVLDIVVHPKKQFAAVLLNNASKKAEQAAMKGAASSGDAGKFGARAVNIIIQMIDLSSLSLSRSYVVTSLGGGDPLRLALDPSGTLLAVSCTDKSVLLLDWMTGAVLGSFFGHAGAPLAVKFTEDCRGIVTGSRDGTIMLWQLEEQFSRVMQAKKAAAAAQSQPTGSPAAADGAGGSQTHRASKSTAQSLLGDDSDEEADDESEGAGEASAAAAGPASPESSASPGAAVSSPLPSSLPPLAHGGSSPKAAVSVSVSAAGVGGAGPGAAAAIYKPRVLPAWARSTVVSPEASGGHGANFAAELAAAAEALPMGGMGVGLGPGGVEQKPSAAAAAAGAPKGKWASRVEVGPDGAPVAPTLAGGGKVYGDLGTIGPGTLLLEGDDLEAELLGEEDIIPPSSATSASRKGRSAEQPGAAAGEDDDELEEDHEDEEGSEDGSSSSGSASVGAGSGGPADDNAAGAGIARSALGSSLTAKLFARLREEGKLPASSGASLRAREAQTTAETMQVRQQLKQLGVYDAQGRPVAASPQASPKPPVTDTHVPAAGAGGAAAAADQPASAASAAAFSASAASIHAAASSGAHDADDEHDSGHGHLLSSSELVAAPAASAGSGAGTPGAEPSTPAASLPFSDSLEQPLHPMQSLLPGSLPPLPTSPDPVNPNEHGLASLPRGQNSVSPVKQQQQQQATAAALSSSGSATLQPGMDSGAAGASATGSGASEDALVHASLAALPAKVDHFQSSLQQMLDGFGAVRAVLAAASTRSSTGASRTGGARPKLAVRDVAVSLSFAAPPALDPLEEAIAGTSGGSGANNGAAAAAPPSSSATLPFTNVSALAPAQLLDLDTVQELYEQQLDAMETLLAQARPQRFRQGQLQQQQTVVPPAAAVAAAPASSPSASGAAGGFDPLAQSQAFSAQLAEMREMRAMLARIEAHTLSTTQQLSLGLTLSAPANSPAAGAAGPGSLPPKSFSRSPEP